MVDENLIKIKIQFIQNEIHFKERLSKQLQLQRTKSCLTRSMSHIAHPILLGRAVHFS